MWHKKSIFKRPDKVVAKMHDGMGKMASVIIPTIMYPLNGDAEIFTYENTVLCEEEAILSCFDKTEYRVGHCYDNTDRLVKALTKQGINAVPYCGWLFTGENQFPVHHCWCVVNGNCVLDLCDDFTAMLSGENGENFKPNMSKLEMAELIADFQIAAKAVANRLRCSPVGTPTPFLYYVGCPCDPEEGRRIYRRLMAMFPHHECERNCDARGMNETQRIMARRGLMK